MLCDDENLCAEAFRFHRLDDLKLRSVPALPFLPLVEDGDACDDEFDFFLDGGQFENGGCFGLLSSQHRKSRVARHVRHARRARHAQ